MSRRVRTQDVSRFVAEVRAPSDEAVQGTAVMVSTDGYVLTAYHVAAAASPTGLTPGEVVAYITIPANAAAPGPFEARYIDSVREADIALLRIDHTGDLDPDVVAVLGAAADSFLNQFVSYGFRALGEHVGGFATGRILGPVVDPAVPSMRHPPIQIESAQIAPGMSGSPILDMTRNLVVGLITDTWVPDRSGKDRDTAWATDLANLESLDTEIQLSSLDLPKSGIKQAADLSIDAEAIAVERPGYDLHVAPPPVARFRGRESLLRQLEEDHGDHDVAITSLIGFAGQGKSALLRAWIDQLIEIGPKAAGVFWWSFDSSPSIDDFFRQAILHFADEKKLSKEDKQTLFEAPMRAVALGELIRIQSATLVLDGAEAAFDEGRQGYLNSELRELVRSLASEGETSHCIISSRFPILDLIDVESQRTHAVQPIKLKHAVQLLRDQGVDGADDELESLCEALDRHALSLTLVGSLIAQRHGGNVGDFSLGDSQVPGATDEELQRRFDSLLLDYDAVLNDEQGTMLKLLSVQRVPMSEEVLDRLHRSAKRSDELLRTLTELTRRQFVGVIDSLVETGLVMRDEEARTVACHVLVKNHYATQIEDAPWPQRRDFYYALAKAFLKGVAPKTLGMFGLGALSVAGGIASATGGAIGAGGRLAGEAVMDDPMLLEASHFLWQLRKKKDDP